jgi:hypothetical protein
VAPLVVATGLMWIDVFQSIEMQHRHPPRLEGNPFLGNHASDAKLILVGGVLPTLLLGAVWYALPYAWRVVPPVTVAGVEAMNVWANAHDGQQGFSLRIRGAF